MALMVYDQVKNLFNVKQGYAAICSTVGNEKYGVS